MHYLADAIDFYAIKSKEFKLILTNFNLIALVSEIVSEINLLAKN